MGKMKKGDMMTGMTLPKVGLHKHIGCKGQCNASLGGKQASGPFKPTSHKYSNTLQLVHADLMGPVTRENHEGETYALCV